MTPGHEPLEELHVPTGVDGPAVLTVEARARCAGAGGRPGRVRDDRAHRLRERIDVSALIDKDLVIVECAAYGWYVDRHDRHAQGDVFEQLCRKSGSVALDRQHGDDAERRAAHLP